LGVAPDPDDELARTATAEGQTPAPAEATVPAGTTVGRYRLERELGVGGMGVVHVAFDPDLERRVALKLLRAAGGDAAKRLQREARAMARLTHPNVVTVHEVGSAGGRDYVAMELIEGETLAEWLRSRQREPHEILEAFIAAGRGLAAAHDAGIVHRDFKPHNVLRSRKGRVAVTDFGLARESHVQPPTDPLEVTLPLAAGSASGGSRTPSSLAGLTVTGSVLGTPAYMAPEQWNGGAVTPATDQFGYCVALWEAFTGQRPFVGPSVEELRAQVAAGPQALDASKLPRRLRSVLRRGLDPDPARRWPSMHDVIAQLERADRRKAFAAVGAGLLLAAVGLFFVLRSGAGATTPGCVRPVLDPAAVWNDAARMPLAKGRQAGHVRALEADVRSWTETRAKACAAETSVRVAALTCLDGVIVRLDAVVRALHQLGDTPFTDAGGFLIDPARCLRTPPPRLSFTPSTALVDVIAARLREETDPRRPSREVFDTLTRRVAKEPCASALAQLIGMELRLSTEERDRVLSTAEQDAEACGDDRIRAEVALAIAQSSLEAGYLAESRLATVRRADAAVQRVAQADLIAQVDLQRAAIAARLGDFEQAVTRSDAAAAGFAARHRSEAQIIANLTALAYRKLGGRAADLDGAIDRLVQWRELGVARAGEDSEIVRHVDRSLAQVEIDQGDLATATARLVRARRPLPQEPARTVTGRVVDETGTPVAGATVALASDLIGTPTSAAVHTGGNGSYRETASAADGSFVIAGAPDSGVVIASLGDRRALPQAIADPVELRLIPTSRIEGKVDLRGVHSGNAIVAITAEQQPPQLPYVLLATLHPDGRFEADGVPRGKVMLSTGLRSSLTPSTTQLPIELRDPVHRGIALQIPEAGRQVTMLVRSTLGTPLQNAQVFVIGGTVSSTSVLDFMALPTKTRVSGLAQPLTDALRTPAIQAVARPGDLVLRLGVPDGEATACATALPDDFGDPDLRRKLDSNLDKLTLTCAPITANEILSIEVPPFPRLD
jgi:predicted Ser/Thr protein kinase